TATPRSFRFWRVIARMGVTSDDGKETSASRPHRGGPALFMQLGRIGVAASLQRSRQRGPATGSTTIPAGFFGAGSIIDPKSRKVRTLGPVLWTDNTLEARFARFAKKTQLIRHVPQRRYNEGRLYEAHFPFAYLTIVGRLHVVHNPALRRPDTSNERH